jgi:oligopeptide transport system substrate-binding protein
MLVLGLAVSVAASGCSPKAAETTDKPAEAKAVKGGTFNYYINEPAYIDPYNTQESEGTNVEQMLFDSLTTIEGETNKVIPAAAESWAANADNTVFTFKLVPGAKFQDGTPVTAESFVYAWTRISDPKTNPKDPSVISYHLAAVKGFNELQEGKATTLAGVKAVDETTFEVTLAESFADFPYVAAHAALAPVPKDAVEKGVDYNGTNVPFAEMPVGNGPFKMSEPWKHDQYIKVVRNEDYYGEKANLDGVNWMIFKDEETAFREFQAGTVDFTSIPSGQVKATIEQFGEAPDGYTVNPAKQTLLGAETAVYYIVLNNKDKSLANPDVRKAINLAINRQAICDSIFEGTRKPATNIVPPGVVGYEAGVWKDAKYDVEGAKAALTAAGFPEGKGLPELTLSFNSGSGH